jgi:hypothetical protein
LAGLGAVTSGQLCVNKIYNINVVVDKVQDLHDENEKKKQDIAVRIESAEQKDADKFRAAYHKYVNNQWLVAADLRVLIKPARNPTGDSSPVWTKLIELQEQWQRRKHQLDVFASFPSSCRRIKSRGHSYKSTEFSRRTHRTTRREWSQCYCKNLKLVPRTSFLISEIQKAIW